MASTTHGSQSQKEKTNFGETNKPNYGTQESVAEQAKGAATAAMDTAREMASTAGKKASEAASYVGQRAEDATSSVGGGMKSLAGTIRENAPREGMLGSASSAVASTLESGGRYLQEHGLSGIGDDLTHMIRRNPVPSLLIAVGVGFLIARATRS
jgi:hypothetical protein